jgi:type IV secretory pathway VirJ component
VAVTARLVVLVTALVAAVWAGATPVAALSAQDTVRGSARDTVRDTTSVGGLPVVEVRPAAAGGGGVGSRTLAVILSGDGGWVAVDREMAAAFAREGVAVVGWNLRDYLHRARTPDETAHDLTRVLTHYLAAWHLERAVVVGYSRGADLAPFMVSRLAADLRQRIVLVAFLGPSEWAGFQFHLIDLISDKHRASDLPVRPEVVKLRGMQMLCIYGRGDRGAICPTLDPTLAQPIAHEGGHRVTAHEGRFMAEIILRALKSRGS